MINSKPLMLTALLSSLIGLPIAMTIDHATDWLVDHGHKQAVYAPAHKAKYKLAHGSDSKRVEFDRFKKAHVSSRRQAQRDVISAEMPPKLAEAYLAMMEGK